MMDLPANLDLHRVVFVQVGLSTLASVSVSPSYNLPVHLYGLYNVDNDLHHFPGAADGLRQYSILLVVTFALDLIWMYNWSSSTSALTFILILIGLVIKPISLMTCLSQLNQASGATGGGGGHSFISPLTRPHPSHPSVSPLGPRQHHSPSDHSRGFQRDPAVNHYRPAVPSPLSPTRPGPSSVSHQAQSSHLTRPAAYHEFDLDSDAQNVSDDDLRMAKKELEMRIAQKQQQQNRPPDRPITTPQHQQPSPPHSSNSFLARQASGTTLVNQTSPPPPSKDPSANGAYHTLE